MLPIAVSLGDPAGIGPELAAAAWRARTLPFYVVGSADALAATGVPLAPIRQAGEAIAAFASHLPVIDVPLAVKARPGQPDPANGAAILAALDRAVDDVLAGDAAALTTLPIAKHILINAGFRHPGHTEYLAARCGLAPDRAVMLLAAPALKVVPLSIHVALGAVPALVTIPRILATVRTLANALSQQFGIVAPRIAVAGLNPHAGEAGKFGREEIDVIIPALDQLRGEGIRVSGPHAADSMFHAEARATYDAALAMYHDQALIPLKTLDFHHGVNVTLGLPIIRTSPDHGTGFGIAGIGIARSDSFIAALDMAAAMAARRHG